MACSFCGKSEKSREHIYSNSILEVFKNEAPLTIDPIRKKVHQGDPIIRDLCCTCNSKMSYLDSYAGTFFSNYGKVIHSTGTSFNLKSELLAKWCVKTASNMERWHNRNRLWWKDFKGAFLDEKILLDSSRISVFLAAWQNKSPIPQGGVLEGHSIRVLDFVDANVKFCNSVQSGKDEPDHLYSLKVGSFVFLVCIWGEGKDKSFLLEELKEYGWEILNADFVSIKKIPFNIWTSDMIGMIHDPSKIYLNGKLVDIPS